MPELPDITVYCEALERRVIGRAPLSFLRPSPFVVRSVAPPPDAAVGRPVTGIERIGKRIVVVFEDELFVVCHLMIAGRLRWLELAARSPGRIVLAELAFDNGRLVLTEAGRTRRASLHVVEGRAALQAFHRGGIDVRIAEPRVFADRLRSENHTLKRALTDPRLFDGIGNAYSDEILHRARLSPLTLTSRIDDDTAERLRRACAAVLTEWTDRLRAEAGDGWPMRVTAFREGMAVHGRYRLPCPVCGSPVQRIRYAQNETNYCATCQTGGRLLADRGLSRLLKDDWPRSIDEYDGRIEEARGRSEDVRERGRSAGEGSGDGAN